MNMDKDCPANAMFGLMVNPCFGAPAFISRLIPVCKLKAEFVFDQIVSLITCIHNSGGYVFAIMSDNLKTNQKCFTLFHNNYSSDTLWSVLHPISNDKFPVLFLLYDPVHLFKNIRNNWVGDWVLPRRKDNNILFNTL